MTAAPRTAVEQRNKILSVPLVNAAEAYVLEHGVSGMRAYLRNVFDLSEPAIESLLKLNPRWRKRRDAAQARWKKDQEQAALEPTHPQLRELERKNKEQAADLSVLNQKLAKADATRTLVQQLTGIIKEEIQPWEPKKLVLAAQPKAGFPVDAAVSLSDEHADEVIAADATWGLERYNFDVFRIRLERWTKVTAAYLSQHLPRYKFERLWIHKLGDSQHGNLHLPGQKYRNHFGNDLRAAIAVGEAEADAIEKLLAVVPEVIVVSVPGNHPRQTPRKDYGDPHDNLDYLVTVVIQLRLRKYIEEGRVQVHAPRSYSAYTEIRGRVNALNHGDDVQGTWGIPWYGFSKHESRVQALVARVAQRVDFFWYGHFHTDVGVTENGSRALHAGAFTLTDDYVINKLKAANEPSQLLEIFDEPKGRILEVPIYLREPELEARYWAGSYQPGIGRRSALTDLAWTDELAKGGKFPLIKARDAR